MDTNTILKMWKNNIKKLEQADKQAKEQGKLVGRFIDEPCGDGAAVYKIIRENKHTVRLRVVVNIGDDYIIPYWGEEATLDKSYVLAKLDRRDNFTAMFANK